MARSGRRPSASSASAPSRRGSWPCTRTVSRSGSTGRKGRMRLTPDLDLDGLDLVETYMAAVRARVEFRTAPSPCVVIDVDARSMRIDTRPFTPWTDLMLADLE